MKMKKIVSEIMLTLLLTSILTLAFKIQQVKAQTEVITIYPDGSIGSNPNLPPPPIQRNGDTYTLTGNISDSMIDIEKNNIVFDGAGYTSIGTPSDVAFYLDNIIGVTIKNTTIEGYGIGICLVDNSSNNMIIGNSISSARQSMCDLWLEGSSNKLYHNNFLGYHPTVSGAGYRYPNIFDDGYPSGGNYWGAYTGVDLYHGPGQNIMGGDGIGDTPYVIDSNNMDHYPLMKPYPWPAHDIGITYVTASGITRVAPSKAIVGQGYNVSLGVLVFNYGNYAETFNVTAYVNTIEIGTKETTLTARNSTSLTFIWDTTGFAYGNYNVWAYASPVPGETDTADNTYTYGIIAVALPAAYFVASPSPFYMGQTILFNATDSYGEWNGTGYLPITEYAWNWGDGSPLENDTTPKAFHSFAYGGSYLVTLRVKDFRGDISDWFEQMIPIINEYPPPPDVAVTGVTLSSNFAYIEDIVSISADIRNLGAFAEAADVTAYADRNVTVIGDEITIGFQSLSFPAASYTTLSFAWNTTGVPLGNYTISVFARNLTQDADLTNNLCIDGKIEVSTPIFIPLNGINITCPRHMELNPPIFNFNYTLTALQASLGNITIKSTGYEGQVPISGSTNDSVHLSVGQPNQELGTYYLPINGSITVPLWLLFEAGTEAHDWSYYQGLYGMQLSIGGNLTLSIAVNVISIDVCHNGAWGTAGGTVTFTQTVTGGSWVYLEAEPHLPLGWSFTVDPPLGILFETPHQMTVNITAAPHAKEGDIGSVTLRAYHNGTGLLIWQYTFFSSVSTMPPTIVSMQPPVSTNSGDLLFNATVKDKSGIKNVTLCYSINNGPWNNQTMQLKSGDTFNPSIFVSTIPSLLNGDTLAYYVAAADWLGRQTYGQIRTMTIENDLAAITVKSGKTTVGQGYKVPINLTIANYGTLSATSLKVYVYANSTCIYTKNVPFIENGTTLTVMFNWSTVGIPKGNYLLSGGVSAIVGEANTLNNDIASGTVKVTIPGDVDGDQQVTILDVVRITGIYALKRSNPGFNPNADIDGDGKITILDVIACTSHYAQKWP
jgi:hypothetical protein